MGSPLGAQKQITVKVKRCHAVLFLAKIRALLRKHVHSAKSVYLIGRKNSKVRLLMVQVKKNGKR